MIPAALIDELDNEGLDSDGLDIPPTGGPLMRRADLATDTAASVGDTLSHLYRDGYAAGVRRGWTTGAAWGVVVAGVWAAVILGCALAEGSIVQVTL